jgi:hypothetical protein
LLPIQSSNTLTIRSPYDGSVSGIVALASRTDTEAAVAAARAFRDTPNRYRRSEILETTRQALEKMLTSPETRVGAADILEPVYRKENAPGQLVRVLEARAEGTADGTSKLALLDEASKVAERELKTPRRLWSSPVGRWRRRSRPMMASSVHVSMRSTRWRLPRAMRSAMRRCSRLRSVTGPSIARRFSI